MGEKICHLLHFIHCEFKLAALHWLSYIDRLQAARQLEKRFTLQLPRWCTFLWEHVVWHGEGVSVMRCGSICSISVHCTKLIHIFPYTNGSMCAFKKPQADMDCLLLSCRQNTSYKPANQSQPLSHRSGKWEIVTMKERSIKERKWEKQGKQHGHLHNI